jgi:Fic family protein
MSSKTYRPPFAFTTAIVASVSRISELLGWLPVETVVRDRQQDYYAALANADNEAEATPFVAFMLNALEQALVIALQNHEGVSDEVNDGVKTKLDDLDRQLLECIRREPYITQEQLVVLSGKSLSTIQRRIRKLRQHHIEGVGSDKTGYWKIK